MALRQINLVPWDKLEKATQTRHLKFWFKALLLVLALLATAYGIQYRHLALLQSQLPMDNGINLQARQKLDEFMGLRKQVEAIYNKQQAMAGIVRSQVFYDMIASVADCLNPDTWIVHFSTRRDQNDPKQLSLECRGVAADHHALGQFLERLSTAPGIHDLLLKDASAETAEKGSEIKNSGKVRFTLSCLISRIADQ